MTAKKENLEYLNSFLEFFVFFPFLLSLFVL